MDDRQPLIRAWPFYRPFAHCQPAPATPAARYGEAGRDATLVLCASSA